MDLATTFAGYLAYFTAGYFSTRYVWGEDVLARLVGRHYVAQNLIPLMFLYFVGEAITFVAWPLISPTILVWRWLKK